MPWVSKKIYLYLFLYSTNTSSPLSDEMEAHRFLEKADEAHTVLEMRSQLRKTGAIGQSERPKTVPLSHYFLFKYNDQSKTLFHDLVTRSQGDNSAAIAEAQAKLDAVSTAFEAAAAAADAAAASLKDAQKREADAEESAKQLAIKEEEVRFFFFLFFFFNSFFFPPFFSFLIASVFRSVPLNSSSRPPSLRSRSKKMLTTPKPKPSRRRARKEVLSLVTRPRTNLPNILLRTLSP